MSLANPYPDASKAFSSAGFRTTIAIGADGKQWETLTPGNDILAVSSTPAAGATTGFGRRIREGGLKTLPIPVLRRLDFMHH
jgi:hypothetical protein